MTMESERDTELTVIDCQGLMSAAAKQINKETNNKKQTTYVTASLHISTEQ